MFSESIRGMRDACKALEIPVTGGNVSFYNESDKGPIFPTPTIAMLGLLEDIDWHVPAHFREAKQNIYLLGDFCPVLGGSEYLYHVHKKTTGALPQLDLAKEANLIEFIAELAQSKLLSSACDLSMGGLALALFVALITRRKGGVFLSNFILKYWRRTFCLMKETKERFALFRRNKSFYSNLRLSRETQYAYGVKPEERDQAATYWRHSTRQRF